MTRATLASRGARTPDLAREIFIAALNEGDLETATAVLARHACLITADATAVHGREEIRALLRQMVERGTSIEVELSSALCAYDVALLSERWRIESRGVEGASFVRRTSANVVLRRIEEEWKLVLLVPWGEARSGGEVLG